MRVIAFLRPGVRNPKWQYFVGFSTPTPKNAHDPIKHRLDTSTRLCDAYIFNDEDDWLLYTTRERIEREFREHPSFFNITEKMLFEAKLKDE